ncbi:MAG: ROK family protein [Candidatus Limnocylindrales bacterium]
MREREAAQPSLLRAINLRATFDSVQARGPIGAAQVVRLTGLSRPTVGDVIGRLLELGLITRVGRTRGHPGPTAQLYDVNPRAGWVLSLDIGRQWVRGALSDLTGTVVARTASRTSASTAPTVIAQLRQAADQLTLEAGISPSDVHQVVVGTPGVIRPGEDHFSLAPSLPGWESPGVINDIRRALAAPVLFENDINLAAVGEHVEGVARGVDDFVLLSVGTGVGMGVVLDGELRRGAAGLAGEIGYLALDMDAAPSERAAAWGAGPFEALVSSSGILNLARANGVTSVVSAADVFAAARSGDAAAAAVVAIEARRLAHAIAAIAAVLDPHLVVLGGGIGTGGGDLLLGPVAEALAAISPFSPRLAISGLGADGVIAGAAGTGLRLALDRIFERAATSSPPVDVERPGLNEAAG